MLAVARPTWIIPEAEFPAEGPERDQLVFALRYAILAPSSHNAQPWRFRVTDDRVQILADMTRRLPIADPEDRELLISCGAALFNLTLALRHFGLAPWVETFPDPHMPELLAEVSLRGSQHPSAEDESLFAAIPHRHTFRLPFDDREPPELLCFSLVDAARASGAWLVPLLDDAQRRELATLVAEGDRLLYSRRPFRQEMRSWMRSDGGSALDGLTDAALGFEDGVLARLAPGMIFDVGPVRAIKDRLLVLRAPLLAVLGTPEDSRRDWLAAGIALSHLLLLAQAHGVSASFLNQPIQVPDLRDRLRDQLCLPGPPQLVLRLGYGREVEPAPRRPLEQVLLTD